MKKLAVIVSVVMLIVMASCKSAPRVPLAPGERVISQGTYILDAKGISRGWAPDRLMPVSEKMSLHLEVVSTSEGDYDLRGWVAEPGQVPKIISHGRVTTDGVPSSVTWQSAVMGKPNFDWTFIFSHGGEKMEMYDSSDNSNWYFHKED